MTRTTIRSEDISAGQVKSADLASGAVPEFDDSILQDNIALLGFKMAVNDSLTQYGMIDGIVDEFHDESGVDTGNSTNLTYDATSDYYTGYTSGTTTHTWTSPGSTASWSPPANTVSGVVKAFGAYGSGQGHGTSYGGIVVATIPLSSSNAYKLHVGYLGSDNYNDPSAGQENWQSSTDGGGLSGIFSGDGAFDFDNSSSNGADTQSRALVIAAGAGGWSHYHYGCHGSSQAAGGNVTSSGGSGTGSGSSSGTQTYMKGGNGASGGGGGYYGGNAGGTNPNGGNSGTNFVYSGATSTTTNSGLAHTSDPDQPPSDPGHGKVHIVTTQQAALDITMQSNAFTAQSAPSKIRAVVFEEDVDTVTINTDFKLYVSRDGGTNWSQITLADEGDYATGKQIWSGEVDVSGQPSDTSVKYKITTHNTKQCRIHGVSLSWS